MRVLIQFSWAYWKNEILKFEVRTKYCLTFKATTLKLSRFGCFLNTTSTTFCCEGSISHYFTKPDEKECHAISKQFHFEPVTGGAEHVLNKSKLSTCRRTTLDSGGPQQKPPEEQGWSICSFVATHLNIFLTVLTITPTPRAWHVSSGRAGGY